MTLRRELIKNLEYLGKNVFGNQDISYNDVVNRLASINPYKPFDRERLQSAVKALYLRWYIKSERPGYYSFTSPGEILEEILSPPDTELFIGQHKCKNVKGIVQIPSKIEEILGLNPVLIPNQVIFDEKERYLVLSPYQMWKRHEIVAILTSRDAGNMHRKICLNISYNPSFDGSIEIPEVQGRPVGIRKGRQVSLVGVGKEVEIWSTEQWEGYKKRHRMA